MKKKRIVSTVLAGLMCATTVGVFSSCTGGSVAGEIHVAFSETGYGVEFMNLWKEEFEKENPNAHVRLEGSPTMNTEVENRLQTGTNVPDVFIVLDMGWQKQAASGRLEPLNDIYSAPADDSGMTIEQFMNPAMRDYGKLTDGNYYAVPWTDGPTSIIYNKDMFEKYGWDESPDTVADLIALCETINNQKDEHGASIGVKPFALYTAYGGYLVDTWWAQYEGAENYQRFFDYENPYGYVQKGRVAALKAFEDVFTDPDTHLKTNMANGVSDHTTAQREFGLQHTAMIVEGAWVENEGKTYLKDNEGNDNFNYAMMPMPYVDGVMTDEDGTPINTMASQAGDFMCIPKSAKNVTGAKEFLKFINSKRGCELFTLGTNGAIRPFQYSPRDVEGVQASDFMRTCWDVYEAAEIVYGYSTSPMQWRCP